MQWPLARFMDRTAGERSASTATMPQADGSGTSRTSAVVNAEQIGLHWLKFASTMRRNQRMYGVGAPAEIGATPAGGVAALGIVEAIASLPVNSPI
jgi:hypothetical protein